jgi:kynurenine formamidase
MTGDTKISVLEQLGRIMEGAEIIDLTYVLEPAMPAWPTQARFGSVVYDSYDYGDDALHSMITMSEHTGTHIDAPKHFIRGGLSVDALPLKAVMGRGVRIEALGIKERGLLEVQAIREFERKSGEIEKGDIVMFRFGWDKKYRLQPEASEYLRDWPGLSKESAEYLATKGVKAVGSDTLAIDAFASEGSPAHHALLGQGIPIIENICSLEKLPVFSFVIGLPNKFKEGSGSPLRLVAVTEKA